MRDADSPAAKLHDVTVALIDRQITPPVARQLADLLLHGPSA